MLDTKFHIFFRSIGSVGSRRDLVRNWRSRQESLTSSTNLGFFLFYTRNISTISPFLVHSVVVEVGQTCFTSNPGRCIPLFTNLEFFLFTTPQTLFSLSEVVYMALIRPWLSLQVAKLATFPSCLIRLWYSQTILSMI